MNSAVVAQMNRECFCLPLEQQAIYLDIAAGDAFLLEHLQARSSLFAGSAVFISAGDLSLMRAVVDAVEAAARLASYREQAWQRNRVAPHWRNSATDGLLMAYDFHLAESGPQLIEINTNAGGAFLVNALHHSVLDAVGVCGPVGLVSFGDADVALVDMLLSEWQAAGEEGRPDTVAIVDQGVAAQYLLPDMLLAQRLFESAGIRTLVADIDDLQFKDGVLRVDGERVDMVYNRHTDFSLVQPEGRTLNVAAKAGAVVVSPAPQHHALYADKRNLLQLSNVQQLVEWGLPGEHALTLRQHIPGTEVVTAELWSERRKLFFKPANGFGSRAVYRGDKLTRRVWQEVLDGGYVAQARIDPPLRAVRHQQVESLLKYDIRMYTYAGQPLLVAARAYQGQTTNFRTAGGGFAPIFSWPASA